MTSVEDKQRVKGHSERRLNDVDLNPRFKV